MAPCHPVFFAAAAGSPPASAAGLMVLFERIRAMRGANELSKSLLAVETALVAQRGALGSQHEEMANDTVIVQLRKTLGELHGQAVLDYICALLLCRALGAAVCPMADVRRGLVHLPRGRYWSWANGVWSCCILLDDAVVQVEHEWSFFAL